MFYDAQGDGGDGDLEDKEEDDEEEEDLEDDNDDDDDADDDDEDDDEYEGSSSNGRESRTLPEHWCQTFTAKKGVLPIKAAHSNPRAHASRP